MLLSRNPIPVSVSRSDAAFSIRWAGLNPSASGVIPPQAQPLEQPPPLQPAAMTNKTASVTCFATDAKERARVRRTTIRSLMCGILKVSAHYG